MYFVTTQKSIIIRLQNRGEQMKNKFLALGLITMLAAPAMAEPLTTSQTASREYLLNHGHSSAVAEAVEKTNSWVNGTPYDAPAKKEYPDGPMKWIRNLFIYFDPALDQNSFMNHNTKFTPQIDDL